MMRLISLVGILAAAFFGTPALAATPECNLVTRATSVQQAYDPFASANVLLDVTISVTNTGAKACQARYYLAPINGLLSLANGNDRLLYRIDAPRGSVQSANSFGPFLAQPAPGATDTFVVRIVVPPQQIVPRGDYVSDLDIAAIGQDTGDIIKLSAPITLRVRVMSRVEMSISGAMSASLANGRNSGAAIAFGDAAPGKTGRVFVHVWSNGGVNVSLDSANGGKLKLLSDAVVSTIDYTARFDGRPAPLANRFTIGRSPPPNLAGGNYELAVTLGETAGKFAGTYKDVITVTVDQN